MSSLFDSDVRSRREHTPWARMSAKAFLHESAWNGAPVSMGDQPLTSKVEVHYRGDVASRLWFVVTFVTEDRVTHTAEAQDLELALWRAAEVAMEVKARLKEEERIKKEGPAQ